MGDQNAVFLCDDPSGNGQRTVQPGGENAAAVFFHIEPGVMGILQTGMLLQPEGGGVAVSSGNGISGGPVLRNTEGDQGRAISGGVIPVTWLQSPYMAFL